VLEPTETTGSIVIIPARGGSKRIPGKNTRLLAGTPVLQRTIEIAQAGNTDWKIFVSTDSDQVANLASTLGVQVIERPADLADDHTPLLPVVNHALGVLSQFGLVKDTTPVACLYATAVTLDPSDFARGFEQLISDSPTQTSRMVTGVVEYLHPIERALTLDSNGNLESISPQFASTRTQDLPVHYFDAGAFIWGFARDWYSSEPVLTRARGCVLPAWRSVDLDTESDWMRAELVIGELQGKHR
jgi:pseudaminic acid cytidylyltransferase